jgi:hypothetical protein
MATPGTFWTRAYGQLTRDISGMREEIGKLKRGLVPGLSLEDRQGVIDTLGFAIEGMARCARIAEQRALTY